MKILTLVFVLFTTISFTQKVIPFVDFNNYFRTFESGTFRQLEFQRIESYKSGDEAIAYYDNRGNLRIYNGGQPIDVANLNADYQVSDHLITWKIGETLNLWDDGNMQTLTYRCGDYAVKDSIVVYQDNRYNSINVYWKNQIYPIKTTTGDLVLPAAIGENIIAYKDNGDFYKIFWNGKPYEIDVWVGNIDFSCGTDILCYNDPTTRTFAVFENGELIDVEQFFMKSYKAGRGFVVYEDQNGNLIKYQSGKRTTLTNFGASKWEVKDDVVIWFENNFLNMECGGKTWRVCNYVPKDYELKNNVLAFRNISQGVDVSIDGETHTITNQMDAAYEILGSSVLVKLFNNSYKVYWKGRTFEP
jgi:hypothetical protein